MPTWSHKTLLVVTDQQRSVLNVIDASTCRSIAHTPYGHRPSASGLLSLLGFNGERPDPVTGCYLLGNGYRAFNPVLMRFNSPDSWSPFGKGGVNAYSYCVGDPVNRRDPTGHNWVTKLLRRIKQRFNTSPDSSPRPSIGVETPSSHLAGQSSPAENLDNIAPPPPYSPPRNRPEAMAQATDPGLALTNENELLDAIRRQERLESIQRALLNDVDNGYMDLTPSEHADRVSQWRETQRSIVELQNKIPPPSYFNATDLNALPRYQNAIRKT